MEYIAVTVDKGIALLEFNRPELLNALHEPMLLEMITALQELAGNDEVRALIVTGRGRGFCGGADLTTVSGLAVAGESMGKQVSDQMQRAFNPMMELLYDFPRPVVSAINGIAAGGGAAIALCADIVLASHSAALKVVQVPQLGIVADLGANWLLPRIIGRSRALGACITGETLKALRLQEWGLVWECVEGEQLVARAKELAERMASVPAETIVATRRMVDGASRNSFADTIEQERQCQERLCDAPFFTDSVTRFLERG
jgi:2-(1,2-epoxy-1,2-dihydrophenyl)acetyl-CoA isomerase